MPLTPDIPPNPSNAPRLNPKAPQGPAKPDVRPQAPATPRLPGQAADAARITQGVTDVQPRGKRPLAAYAPEPADLAGPAPAEGEMFSSKNLQAPPEPGMRVVKATSAGDFEVQVEWDHQAGGMAPTGVGVRANAAGAFVTVDGAGAVRVGGELITPERERPQALAGGGSITDWGDGYLVVESERGDSVSVFARGERVDFMGRLSAERPAPTPAAGE